MRKSERLFRLLEVLRGRRLAVTAATLAELLDVSQRTVYRDIASLQASGAPIEGEAGIGYVLDQSHTLPPLMFDPDEVQALLAGLRMARAFTDDEMAHAAIRAEEKVRAVLDDNGLRRADRSPYFAPIYDYTDASARRALHLQVRRACESQCKLRIGYCDQEGKTTERVIHPFALLRWETVWTLIAWCELRQDDRHFRLDRIAGIEVLEDKFGEESAEAAKSLRARLETGLG
ncbi:MAG: YafY family protein [Pseudomonadota bacterium]